MTSIPTVENQIKNNLEIIQIKNKFDYSVNDTALETFELLQKFNVSDNFDLYVLANKILGYYFGKTHNYLHCQECLDRLSDTQENLCWKIFKNTQFPIMALSEEHEKEVINNLMNSFKEFDNSSLSNININPLHLSDPFWFGYIDINPKKIFKNYSELQMKVFPSISSQKLVDYNVKNNKIKIGIISGSLQPLNSNPNIHSSSISDSFYSTFLNLSKDIFEVIFIYYNTKNPNIMNDKNIYLENFQPTVECIKNTQKKIASSNLDMLLFLDLHIQPELNFLALSKLAKIQMCTHGHPVTSGIPRDIMNYFISWEAAEIENAQEHYTEELMLIPKNIVWEHFTPRNNNISQMSMLTGRIWGNKGRSELEFLPENIDINKNWYFCSQATFKLHYKFDEILKNILEKDKDALIFLIKVDKELYSLSSQYIERLKNNNIDLDRIVIIDKLKHHDMMALYNNIDVALDSFFFGGDTTTREAFEIGTPIVTLPHKYLGSRWTQAYYHHMGITDLIATDIDHYVELAVKVGTDKAFYNELRERIKNNSHKIFYSKEASKAWEQVLLDIYQKEEEKNTIVEVPVSIKIPKIIIQTGKHVHLCDKLKFLTEKVKKLHPDFEYKFFTDEDVETFIKENYPEYYDTFSNFKYPIQKYDFFRYLAVYHYGGFYLDLDMDINLSLEELCQYDCVFPRELKKNSDIYLQNKGMDYLIGNYCFGASKHNTFLKYCIDNIVDDSVLNMNEVLLYMKNSKEKYVYYKTGHVLVSASYLNYSDKENIHILEDEEDTCFGKFGKHLAIGSWQNDKKYGGTEMMINRLEERVDMSEINIKTSNMSNIHDPSKPIVYYCHDLPNDQMYSHIDTSEQFVFVSNYQKNQFIEKFHLDNSKCHIINNGIVPFDDHIKNNQTCRIIYHSTPHRGLDILVQVFSQVASYFFTMGIPVHLDVYSSFKIYNRPDLDYYFNSLYEKIKEHPNMTYHGSVSNNEVREALSNSDIFAYPSTFSETSCMCLMEAMSAGCVCVHSSLGALPETSNNYTLMYDYTEDKMEHCTRFAETLIKAVLNYKNISVHDQKNYADTAFNIETIADQWKDFIENIQ